MLSGFHASPQSWRRYRPEPVKIIDDDILEEGDIWAVAKKDLLATKYFGIEFIELVNIAIRYQKSLPVPVSLLLFLLSISYRLKSNSTNACRQLVRHLWLPVLGTGAW